MQLQYTTTRPDDTHTQQDFVVFDRRPIEWKSKGEPWQESNKAVSQEPGRALIRRRHTAEAAAAAKERKHVDGKS